MSWLSDHAAKVAAAREPASSDPAHYENFDRFRDALFNEVMPQVEKTYSAARDQWTRPGSDS